MSRELRHRASLALNAVLAVTVSVLLLHKPEPASAPPTREAGTGGGVNPRSETNAATTTSETPAIGSQAKPLRYADIASASDRRRWMVDQLRAMGVPNEILAQVVQEDIEVHWEDRFSKESRGADADTMAAMQLEHDLSKDAEMRAALGDEGFKQWDEKHMLREANIGKIPLSDAETEAIYALKKKTQQRQLDLEKARVKGEMDDADIDDASYKAYCEFHDQLKALLGDDRYAKSQGMDQGAATTNLRQEMAEVNPSDSQLQELLKAQQQWNERRSELDKKFQDDQGSAAYVEQIKALDEERDQEYRRVLGTNVFDTFQKEKDAAYSTMKKYETLWGLDDSKIDYVYGTLKYYEKSVEDYMARARALEAKDQSVDWDAVNENLRQFAEQTQQALQLYLGKDSFEKLQRNSVFQFNQTQSPRGRP
jgi:hypothetical protein